jgi:hypothetical protein
MSIHMSETIQEERSRWVLPIVEGELKLCDVATVCPYGKRTLERWVAAYREGGKEASSEDGPRRKFVFLWHNNRFSLTVIKFFLDLKFQFHFPTVVAKT